MPPDAAWGALDTTDGRPRILRTAVYEEKARGPMAGLISELSAEFGELKDLLDWEVLA
jgi:hypothetical protein